MMSTDPVFIRSYSSEEGRFKDQKRGHGWKTSEILTIKDSTRTDSDEFDPNLNLGFHILTACCCCVTVGHRVLG